LADHQGTVRDVVRWDDANTETEHVEHYQYDAFGNLTAIVSAAGMVISTDRSTAVTRYQYTGRDWDSDSGLQYNRARWYDPATGRWISEDPIGFVAGDANLYRYVGNSSTNAVDPEGLDWLDTVDAAFAGFADAITCGGTTKLRECIYGDIATKNHKGTAFRVGQGVGVVTGCALGYGAATNTARGTSWGIQAARYYVLAEETVGLGNFGYHTVTGQLEYSDAFALIPVAGFAGGQLRRVDDELVLVSRWGREGLENGDWIMRGPADALNYVNSFKWQPGCSNKFAPFSSGKVFVVPATSISPVTTLEGFKIIFGQFKYSP
jgi:RHS repeat-associated protein